MGVYISLLPSFVLLEHLVLFFHIYTFLLLFTDKKKKKKKKGGKVVPLNLF